MTYENAITELVELYLHQDTMHDMMACAGFSDKRAQEFYGVSFNELCHMYEEAMMAYCDRARELWDELGGYEYYEQTGVLEYDMRSETSIRVEQLKEDFALRPTVYHFSGFMDTEWSYEDELDLDEFSYLYSRDMHRINDEDYDDLFDELDEYLALIDELEAELDAAA